MWLILAKKKMLIIVPIYCSEQKHFLHQTQIFLRLYSFSNLLRKLNFLFISEFLSEIVTFWNKKRSFSEFPQKYFNTTEKHSLAVCGSFWGEKQFLLIFVPFYLFDQNQLFKQIQNFFRIFPFFKLLRKINFLSISVQQSVIVTFLTTKRSFQLISPKMLQNNRKA